MRKWASLRRTTDATAEPVSGADMVAHLNLPSSTDSTYLGNLAKASRQVAERYLGRAFITQSWTMFLDGVPAGILELPYPPVSSVTSFSSFDRDDTETSYTVGTYLFVDTSAEPARLIIQEGQAWPADTRTLNRYKIVYSTGYGAAGTNVPQQILEGIKQTAAYMYEHRGDCNAESALIDSGAAMTMESLRIHTL